MSNEKGLSSPESALNLMTDRLSWLLQSYLQINMEDGNFLIYLCKSRDCDSLYWIMFNDWLICYILFFSITQILVNVQNQGHIWNLDRNLICLRLKTYDRGRFNSNKSIPMKINHVSLTSNIPAKTWSNWTCRGCFEIGRTSRFQICPWFWKLTKIYGSDRAKQNVTN